MSAGEPRYLCRLCDRLLETPAALLEHYQTAHHLQGPPDARTPPLRSSRQNGAWRFGRQRGNGQVLKN